jgi:hypothetical protein
VSGTFITLVSAKDDTHMKAKKRPVAAPVSLQKMDRESLALSTNPQFLRIIESARKEIREGKTISLEALRKKFGLVAPNRKMQRTRKTRRSS